MQDDDNEQSRNFVSDYNQMGYNFGENFTTLPQEKVVVWCVIYPEFALFGENFGQAIILFWSH